MIDDLLNSGNSQSFDYTATSRLVEATGSYGNLTYSYDAIGNRLNKTDNNQSEDYIYKVEDHHLESITGETTTNYTYNAIGQAIQKGDMTFTYGFNGRMQSATNNGETAQYNYDHRNLRVSKLIDTTRTWTAYNPQGQILAEQTQVLGVPRQRHDYDVEYIYLNGQLLSVIQTPIEVFTYGEDHKVDEGHNENSQTGNWTQEKTRKAWGGYHITASGNTGASFTWSKFLLGGTYKVYANWVNDRKNNTQAQYQIQHAGQLETITVDQTQRGEWHLLGTFEFSGEGNEHVTLTDAGGKVSADAIRFERVADLSTEPKIYFAHNNHLSTPTKLTDINGTVVWSADYTPFGLASVNDDVDGNNTHIPFNIRFPGQYYDQETGLHYNWHRYYDPEIGRYIQSDPIGLAGGISTYGYVSGNPVNQTDRTGLIWDGDRYFGQPQEIQDAMRERNNTDSCGCLAKTLGLETATGAGLVASGLPVIPYPRSGLGAGSSTGATSLASRTLSRAFPQRLPVRIPTPTISNLGAGTRIVGRAAGRLVPIVGWGLLAYDVSQLASCLAKCEEGGECKVEQ